MASRTIFARRLPLALTLAALLVVASAETPLAASNAGMELSDSVNNDKAGTVQDILLDTNDQRQIDQVEEQQGGEDAGEEEEKKEEADPALNDEKGDDGEKKPEEGTPEANGEEAKSEDGAKDEEENKPAEDAKDPAAEEKPAEEQKETESPIVPDNDEKPEDKPDDSANNESNNNETDKNEEEKKTEEKETAKEENKISKDNWDDDEGSGAVGFFLFVVFIGLGAFAFKRKDKIMPIVQDFIDKANKGFDAEAGGVSKSTKYQQV